MRGLFGREVHRLLAMNAMDPADCLRSLTAEALAWAHPDRPLFPVSLRVMAVANALVMLGLLPEPQAEAVLAEHRLALEGKGLGNGWGVTKGELTVRPGAHEYWQSRAAGPGGLREVPLGTSDPPWPTAAECYLAALAPVTSYSISDSVTESTAGPEDTAEIVAAVADSLMAVGALPVTSTLLSGFPASGPGWHIPLAHRWGRRAGQQAAGFRAAEHRGLAVRLPLEHATAVIESVCAQGELVSIQL